MVGKNGIFLTQIIYSYYTVFIMYYFVKRKPDWFNLNLLRSPLWLCLLFTLLVRIWLVIHNNATIEGDEALVGIQAEHILHGEHPIYFYGQPYMGSLEAYLVALIFALVGPSSWALRAEPTVLSLIVTWLTWKLAGVLADAAKLSPSHRLWFQSIAALGAAFPPLYDLVIELRTLGGYIEAFVIILAILYTTLRLTQRWQEKAQVRELVWRWALLGFLIGLGFWVDPLVIVAVVASAIWIMTSIVTELVKYRPNNRYDGIQSPRTVSALLKNLLSTLAVIPGALVGFAPALYWGAFNQWQNITYIFDKGSSTSSARILSIRKVFHLYRTCTALRVIGGVLPTDPGITAQNPHLITPALLVGLACIVVSGTVWVCSFIWHSPLFMQGRRLLTLPLLFAGSCALIFSVSRITTSGLIHMCGPLDWVGRYAAPLLLSLPFFLAATLTFVYIVFQSKVMWHSMVYPLFLLRIGLIFCLSVYVGVQVDTYRKSNPYYTFQTSGCVIAPENYNPIIAYLQHQHIHYIWANGWIGNVITFETQSNVIAIDPRRFTNRIPAYTNAVLHADRPSILILALDSNPHPHILTVLEKAGITYRTARFPSSPRYGVDVLAITPLNRSVSPSIGGSMEAWFWTC